METRYQMKVKNYSFYALQIFKVANEMQMIDITNLPSTCKINAFNSLSDVAKARCKNKFSCKKETFN